MEMESHDPGLHETKRHAEVYLTVFRRIWISSFFVAVAGAVLGHYAVTAIAGLTLFGSLLGTGVARHGVKRAQKALVRRGQVT